MQPASASDSGSRIRGPGPVVARRARALDLEQHLGAAVRDGLVGADRAAELLAVARVLHRHLHRPLGHAGELGRQRERGDREPGQVLALERLAGVAGAHARVAARGVHRPDRLHLGRGALHHAPVVVAAEHDHLGGVAVGHEPRLAVLEDAERPAQLAGGDAGQPARLLLLAAGGLEHQAGRRVGEERQRRQRVAELLHQDDQLDRAEPLAAVLLGDEDAGPAQLAELVPGGVVVVAALGELAHVLELEALGEQVLGGALDRVLVV